MRGLLKFHGLVMLLSMTVAGWGSIAAPTKSQLAKSLERLQASSEEWRREVVAYRRARKDGALSRSEFEDYAEFIAHLRLRMLRQCEETRQLGGEDAIRKFNCVRLGSPSGGSFNAVPSAPIRTKEEKRQSLNAKLTALEGEIDETLLKRQRQLKETSRNLGQRSGGKSASGRDAGAGKGSSASGAASQRRTVWTNKDHTERAGVASQRRTAASGEEKSERAGAKSAREASSGPLADKGDQREAVGSPPSASGPTEKQKHDRVAKRETSTESGSDDDIIARQLREAAEKEKDPLLKEKLWQEYRKYKRSQK